MRYLSPVDQKGAFEDLYLIVRARENRLLPDEVVAVLPDIPPGMSPNHKEWRARSTSFRRLQGYFERLTERKSLLDVGCGNGWAAASLARNSLLQVSAVDVNEEELLQAERVFQRPNLQFLYGNIFDNIFPPASFDFIVLNSSVQYFEDLGRLVNRLFYFLAENGEIHILDTPFYKDNEWEAARARSLSYFQSMGCPEMAGHYFHHRLSALAPFHFNVLSKSSLLRRISSLFAAELPPNFLWIRIKRH